MEQKCKNCKWEKAPCDKLHCRTFRNNAEASSGFDDYWTPAKPWENKWIVPDGCEILADFDRFYIGVEFTNGSTIPTKWLKSDGFNCWSSPNLIPKTPPIEETDEFKAFCEVHPISDDNLTYLLDEYEKFKKVFTMELK